MIGVPGSSHPLSHPGKQFFQRAVPILTLLWLIPTLSFSIRFPSKQYGVIDGLPQIQVKALQQDGTGSLCIGTVGGLATYDGNVIDHFHPENASPSYAVTSFSHYSSGRIWIGTNSGLYYYENHRVFTTSISHPIIKVRSYGKRVYYSTREGLFLYDGQQEREVLSGNINSFDVGPEGQLAICNDHHFLVGFPDRLRPIRQDRKCVCIDIIHRGDIIYVLSDRGVERITDRDLETVFETKNSTAFTVSPDGSIWVATLDDLYLYSNGKWQTVDFTSGSVDQIINCIFIDRENNVWIGHEDGLVKIAFRTISLFGSREGFPNTLIRSLYVSSDSMVYVGGVNLWGTLDLESGKFSPLPNPTPPNSMIRAICRNHLGQLLLGTDDGTILWGKPGALKTISDIEERPIGQVYHMISRNNRVWIGTERGLVILDNDQFSWIEGSELLHPPVYGLAFDSNGDLYLGTRKGIILYKGEHFQRPDYLDKVRDFEINCLYFDSEGKLWVGTHGAGLYHYNGEWSVSNESQGFPNDFIWSIQEDRNGKLWVCSSKGIHLRQENLWSTFNSEDGLPGEEIFIHAAAQDPEGNLYFGLSRGVAVVHGGSGMLKTPQPPGLLIRRIITNRDRVFSYPNSEDPIILKPAERSITIEYAATSLKNESGTFYTYMIENLSGEWSHLSPYNNTQINFTKPGDYTFHLKAYNACAMFSPTLSLSLSVAPHWYETIWFKGTSIALFLLLTYLALLYRTRNLESQRRKLQIMVNERTSELNEKIKEVETLSVTDPVTGIHNRRYFIENLKQMIALGKRYGKSICVGILDLDHFKEVNDWFGHLYGDRILKQVAEIYLDYFRHSDLVARYGGDEFIVALLTNDTDGIMERFDDLRERVAAIQFGKEDRTINITVSIGLSVLHLTQDVDADFDSLVAVADAALYGAKATGRNKVILDQIQEM